MTPIPPAPRRSAVRALLAPPLLALLGCAWSGACSGGEEVEAGAAPEAAAAAFPLRRPARFSVDIELSEAVSAEAQRSVRASFLRGLREREWARCREALTPDFLGRLPAPGEGEAYADDVLAATRHRPDDLEALDADAFLDRLRAHAADWVQVERAQWRTFEFYLDPERRQALAAVHFAYGGVRPGGTRSELQASLLVELVPAGDGEHRIRRIDLEEGSSVEGRRAPFLDATDAAGFHFNESEANRLVKQGAIDGRAILIYGGLTALDWNRDGFWDLLATEANKHTVLFLNDGRGGFERGALPLQGREQSGSFFLWMDLDGDGLEELVGNRVHGYEGGRAWIGMHTRRGGVWTWLPRALELELPPGLVKPSLQLIVPADVDGNGFPDLYVCGYQNSGSRSERFNNVAAYDGDDNLLFMNHGELRFTEESDARGIQSTQYTLTAQFFDLDADGDLDLFEGNDFGPNVVWENLGGGRFREAAGHPLSRDSGYTMGVTVADWDNSGELAIYVSNMYSHAGNRIVPLARSIGPELHRRVKALAAGNQLFTRAGPEGAWTDVGRELGVHLADWAWGCAFRDLDNDGDRDLVVTNGYTSHRDRGAPDF